MAKHEAISQELHEWVNCPRSREGGKSCLIATLNDLRGFGFFPILLVCFLMLVVLPEIFYGFGFVFIGVYR